MRSFEKRMQQDQVLKLKLLDGIFMKSMMTFEGKLLQEMRTTMHRLA